MGIIHVDFRAGAAKTVEPASSSKSSGAHLEIYRDEGYEFHPTHLIPLRFISPDRAQMVLQPSDIYDVTFDADGGHVHRFEKKSITEIQIEGLDEKVLQRAILCGLRSQRPVVDLSKYHTRILRVTPRLAQLSRA